MSKLLINGILFWTGIKTIRAGVYKVGWRRNGWDNIDPLR